MDYVGIDVVLVMLVPNALSWNTVFSIVSFDLRNFRDSNEYSTFDPLWNSHLISM